jgi:predicted kinase
MTMSTRPNPAKPPTLVVFGGLPGTGKTTLARELARGLDATYLRIDEIEQALRFSGTLSGEVGPAGYMAAYALAESNLRLTRTVVADCVNPISITREAWWQVAKSAGARMVDVEVICSDPVEHRRRVETRSTDVAGLQLPTWQDVLRRKYEPWDRARIVIDTASRTVAEVLAEVQSRIDA